MSSGTVRERGQWHGEREGGSEMGREVGGGSGLVYKKHTANSPPPHIHTHMYTVYMFV